MIAISSAYNTMCSHLVPYKCESPVAFDNSLEGTCIICSRCQKHSFYFGMKQRQVCSLQLRRYVRASKISFNPCQYGGLFPCCVVVHGIEIVLHVVLFGVLFSPR